MYALPSVSWTSTLPFDSASSVFRRATPFLDEKQKFLPCDPGHSHRRVPGLTDNAAGTQCLNVYRLFLPPAADDSAYPPPLSRSAHALCRDHPRRSGHPAESGGIEVSALVAARPQPVPTARNPRRALRATAAVTGTFYLGQGLYTVSLLYLTGPRHLPVAALGACLTVAGFVGLGCAVPIGKLADRHPPQRVLCAALIAMAAAALIVLSAVETVAGALLAGCLYAVAWQGAYTARAALVADLAPHAPAELAARLYRLGNLGFAVSMPLAGAVVALGASGIYRCALAAAACCFLLAAAAAASVPVDPAGSAAQEAERAASARPWRDARYLAVTSLYAVTSLQFALFEFALPLWVVHVGAPKWMVGASALLSTGTVALLQPSVSRKVTGIGAAGRAMATAGAGAGAACLLLAGADHHSPRTAAILVALGAILLAVAEVSQVVGSMTLSYALAPDGAHGVYQGFFNGGQTLAVAAGPMLLAHTVLAHGFAGWAALGSLLAAAGLAVPPLTAFPRLVPAVRTTRPGEA
jgi:MFS family permease